MSLLLLTISIAAARDSAHIIEFHAALHVLMRTKGIIGQVPCQGESGGRPWHQDNPDPRTGSATRLVRTEENQLDTTQGQFCAMATINGRSVISGDRRLDSALITLAEVLWEIVQACAASETAGKAQTNSGGTGEAQLCRECVISC